MLDHIVPTGKASAQVGSQQSTTIYYSSPVSGTKITDKPMFFLINDGSASASEIFVASSKEYARYSKIIGEKSYGKGTVQTMLSYPDGSLLKYTIAKRYTGKDKKNIDKI
jgi:carboxyl-terminal processing protease